MSTPPSFPDHPSIADQLAQQQCARQWRGFFRALAGEFTSALAPADLRALMERVGTRFAADHPLPACQTLDQLQQSMARVWDSIDWGTVTLTQQAEYLEISHSLAPLTAAFGAEHAQWSTGFLEGTYHAWMESAGAGALRLAQAAPADAWGCVRFQLGR